VAVTVDPITLRRVCSEFATGVAIIATEHVGGGVCGLTANAFSSVSLEPPLVLVCLDRSAGTHGCVRTHGRFCASFLAAGQRELALRFAERRDDKFDGVPYTLGTTGSPVVNGSIGHVECEVHDELEGGDHTIFLARVVAAAAVGGEPLVFFRGEYTTAVPGT
jgi:flavin reductase (DIM6/NTAB) family NADH-FMN oxidoreductase RutF